MRFLFGILFFVLVQSYAFSQSSSSYRTIVDKQNVSNITCPAIVDSLEFFFSMKTTYQSYLLLSANFLLKIVSNLSFVSKKMQKLTQDITQAIDSLQSNRFALLSSSDQVIETLSICLEEGSNTQSADCSNIVNSIQEYLDSVEETPRVLNTLVHRFFTILSKGYFENAKMIKKDLATFDSLMKQNHTILTKKGNRVINQVSVCIKNNQNPIL